MWWMFFDFVDIKKKFSELFIKSLEMICVYNSKILMIFSLNEYEVMELFLWIGVECLELKLVVVVCVLIVVCKKIGFDELVVYILEFGVVFSVKDGEVYVI